MSVLKQLHMDGHWTYAGAENETCTSRWATSGKCIADCAFSRNLDQDVHRNHKWIATLYHTGESEQVQTAVISRQAHLASSTRITVRYRPLRPPIRCPRSSASTSRAAKAYETGKPHTHAHSRAQWRTLQSLQTDDPPPQALGTRQLLHHSRQIVETVDDAAVIDPVDAHGGGQ
jgi:hypothetical protein